MTLALEEKYLEWDKLRDLERQIKTNEAVKKKNDKVSFSSFVFFFFPFLK